MATTLDSLASRRRTGNVARFLEMDPDALFAQARQWDAERRVRAVEQLGGYRLDSDDGRLICLETGASYECEDVRRWDALPGVVAYIGCDCIDEGTRLRPLRETMQRRSLGGTPCYCKHHYVRMLLSGHTVEVRGVHVRAAGRLVK